jgi:uncharacterized membrane protein
MRLLRHLFATPLGTRRRFPDQALAAIESAIAGAERRSSGEIRFAIDTALDLPDLWNGTSPRERALEVYSDLRVWDSELRNGVLIYVLMAERDVEIVADRGLADRVQPSDWESACRVMETHFRAGRFPEGAVAGISAVGALLERHFPARGPNRNEQPDQPTLL